MVDALLCTYLSFLYAPAALGLSAMLHTTFALANTRVQARNGGERGGMYLIMIFEIQIFNIQPMMRTLVLLIFQCSFHAIQVMICQQQKVDLTLTVAFSSLYRGIQKQ